MIILQYMQISNHVVHLKRMCCMPIIPQLKKENGKKYCLVGDNLHTVKYPGLKLKRGFLSRRKFSVQFSQVCTFGCFYREQTQVIQSSHLKYCGTLPAPVWKLILPSINIFLKRTTFLPIIKNHLYLEERLTLSSMC